VVQKLIDEEHDSQLKLVVLRKNPGEHTSLQLEAESDKVYTPLQVWHVVVELHKSQFPMPQLNRQVV
jgi:hypothetical protein